MSLPADHIYIKQDVTIRPPTREIMRNVPEQWNYWLLQARERDDVCYFSIYKVDSLVGAIFLHDIDRRSRESLVGYHLFEPENRGRGTGTTALRLLQQFVIEQTDLSTLVIITSHDNRASQRIAEKCGFMYGGAPREGPHLELFKWRRPE